ncbi:DNA repair protein XRCC1-like isoform X1 [Portunus trituberculatus]|uniref:DNA repair protein XRCC1-like isoform X1 n=1 Tax=Portunus trituberculatus TaxID=210409 RepID=UPI001E1CFA62|nr:DNA repair protein XRCC1-like isoform X1 [Portunus trituberculatus]
MTLIKFTQVLSYSSEDANHPADNLLRADTYRKWKCAPDTSNKMSFVILKFENLTSINSLDIGNDGSALVEVLVSREGMNDYQVLLVSSAFMSPTESRNGTDLNRVRMFGPDKLNKNTAKQKWDRLKVVCTQPFNTKMQYGLSFITARSPDSEKQESSEKFTQLGKFKLRMEDNCDPITVGSVFAKRNEKSPLSSTEPGSIRAASREIATAVSSSETLKRKDPPTHGSPSQLKKKAAAESVKSPIIKNTPSSSHTTNGSKGKQNEKQTKTKPERTEGKPTPKNNGGREEREKKKENKMNKEMPNSKPSSSKGDVQETRKKKSKPFTSLMDNVVFVMSGYENPERSILRDKLTEMGAQYRSDWKPGCTHLICAFTNTPKYRQAKGKGKIVTGKWITECYKNKIRYPWKRYGLEKHKDGTESEEEIWAEELLPKVSQPKPKPPSPPKSVDNSDVGDDCNYSDDEDTDDEIQKVLDKQQKNKPDVASDAEARTTYSSKRDSSKSSSEKDRAITTKSSERDSERHEQEGVTILKIIKIVQQLMVLWTTLMKKYMMLTQM